MDVEEEKFETVEVKGAKYGMKIKNNIHLPNGVINLTVTKHFKAREDDIMVSSYPKSGTTWTLELVWLILHDLDFEKSLKTPQKYIWIDPGISPKILDEAESPRIIKNHLPLEFIPDDFKSKKIKRPHEIIKQLGEFLGKNLTDLEIKDLIEFTSFAKMKKNFDTARVVGADEYFMKDMNFYRKGKIGDWRNYFNDETSKKVDDSIAKNLKYKGEFYYGEK